MVPRLWVPSIHWLSARNWNLAASGAALTASRVAKRVAVSTPLRIDSLTVAVMVFRFPFGVWQARSGSCRRCGQAHRKFAVTWDWAGGQFGRLDVDGRAELLLQLDELWNRRIVGQRAGQVEDVAQGLVALTLIAGKSNALFGLTAQCLVERDGEQLGIAICVAQAVAGDRIAVVAGVADECPATTMSSPDKVGSSKHAGDR